MSIRWPVAQKEETTISDKSKLRMRCLGSPFKGALKVHSIIHEGYLTVTMLPSVLCDYRAVMAGKFLALSKTPFTPLISVFIFEMLSFVGGCDFLLIELGLSVSGKPFR